jgi:ribosomal protein S27AE
MGGSDWWARKLGGNSAPTQRQQASVIMPGMHREPPQQQAPPPQSVPTSYDANTGQPIADDGVMTALVNAALSTGGSKKVKEDSGTCPECGSGNFFAQRRTENGMPLRIEAAARCFDCGYPLIQAGSSHGGATAARADGTATKARQLGKGHRVTVVDGGRTHTFDARK